MRKLPAWSFRLLPALPLLSCLLSYAYTTLVTDCEYIGSIVLRDPAEYARELRKEGRPMAARDFLEFQASLPFAEDTADLRQLKAELDKETSSLSYKLLDTGRGFLTGDGETMYGKAAGAASDFTPASDFLDLYREGRKYVDGEEIDELTAALAGIGVACTLMPYAKSSISVLKKLRKFISPKLGRQMIALARELKHTPGAIKQYKEVFTGLKKFRDEHGFAALGNLLSRSDSIEHIGKDLSLARKLGGKAGKYLAFCGGDVLEATEKCGAEAVRNAAAFGPKAVSSLKKFPNKNFGKSVGRWRKFSRFSCKAISGVAKVLGSITSIILSLLLALVQPVIALFGMIAGMLARRRTAAAQARSE